MSKNSLMIGVPYDFGTTFPSISVAMPARRVQLTWQSCATVAPDAVDLSLEASDDDVTWDEIDASTVVGEIRTVNTSCRFLRLGAGSITNGTTNSVQIVAKA